MALVKVLALDATGVIETEIDTGGGGSGGSIIKHAIDLTNGQTAVVVPGGYTSAGIAVYLNGAYLSPAEYTATTSPNITLAVGAPSEDSVLDVVVFAVGASALGDLTDVIITSAVIDEVLKWNGTNWVNGTVAGGGGGASLGSATPLMDGTASAGTAPAASREDHRHPTDTTYASRSNHTGSQLASTISDFAATVLATFLTGLNTATASLVIASDTVLAAIGKLQAQVVQRAYTFLSVSYQPGATYTLNATSDLTNSVLLGHATSTVVSVPQGSTLPTGARYTISGFSNTGVHIVNLFAGDGAWNPETGISNVATYTIYPGDVLQLTRTATPTQWVAEIIRKSTVIAGSGITVTRDSLNRFVVTNSAPGAAPPRANLWTTALSNIWMQEPNCTYVGLGGVYAWIHAKAYNLPIDTAVSGAGAQALISGSNIIVTTGTTASGSSSMKVSPISGGYYTAYGSLATATGGCYFGFTMMANGVLSNGTNRFELYAALGPQTPNHNVWAQCGISILYSDNLNSGNYVIKYSNADGTTITTINTAVAHTAFGLPISISIDKTGASTATIIVKINGTTVATITDSAANTAAQPFVPMSSFFKITKSIGTTDILGALVDPRSGWAA